MFTTTKSRPRFLLTAILVLASTTASWAQQPSPAPPQPTVAPPVVAAVVGDRSGRAIIGFNFGIGGFHDSPADCDVCTSWSGAGWDAGFLAGTFLGRHQAIELELTMLTPAEENDATFGALTLMYSRWLTSRISVRGGYGLGFLDVPAAKKGSYHTSRPGGVFDGGFSVEMVRNRRFSLDATGRFERLRYLEEPKNYASMGISMNFYPRVPKW